MTDKAKHRSTHGEQFMMTARLMTVPGNNFEAGRPLDDSKSTWHSNAMHYAARAAIWRKKNYHEMFNFENWFLCRFSSNTRFSYGGGKNGKRKKEITNINLRG